MRGGAPRTDTLSSGRRIRQRRQALDALNWIGIAVCLAHSAMFSGLNLALFGLSQLRLEVAAEAGDAAAGTILELRQDVHLLLATILWGNVGINVLLTLLSDSVLTGLGAFLFSTVVITMVGEIAPQAYFSRNALRMGALLAPVLKFYRLLLWPVAKPSAKLLDAWLGRQGVQFFRERDLKNVIRMHAEGDSDVGTAEGIGAINFLALDDVPVGAIGEPVDPRSIIQLGEGGAFPAFRAVAEDAFVQRVAASGRKWVVLTGADNRPRYVLDSDGFLRDVLLGDPDDIRGYCHRPVVVTDETAHIGSVWSRLTVEPEHHGDFVIDRDVILVWGDQRRVITGADLLGRLLRGIATRG